MLYRRSYKNYLNKTRSHKMRIFALLTMVLTLSIGNIQATQLDLFAPLDILGVEYRVEKSPYVEGIGETLAVYMVDEDVIILSRQKSNECDTEYFHTILHELTHWTGFRKDRSYRGNSLDIIQEETVAEYVATLLSRELYNGKLEYNPKNCYRYLAQHPTNRKLSEADKQEIMACVKEAYEYLINRLKRLDTKNELMLR